MVSVYPEQVNLVMVSVTGNGLTMVSVYGERVNLVMVTVYGEQVNLVTVSTWFYEHPDCTHRAILLFLFLLTNVLIGSPSVVLKYDSRSVGVRVW